MNSIYDIATQAGVSPRTVSRYFNHRNLLSRKAQEAIAQVIERTGFRPSALANRLSQGRLESVAVLVAADGGLPDDLHRLLLDQVAADVARHGRDLLLIGVDERNEERVIEEHIRQRKLAGLVLMTAVSANLAAAIAAAGLPTVSINWRPRTPMPGNRYVGIDYHESARTYVGGLLARRPARRILFATPAGEDARCQGMRQGAAEAGVPSDVIAVERDAAGADRALAAMRPRLGADVLVICWSDRVALGLMAAARRARLEIPADLALAGFDGLEAGEWVHPVLTTAVQPWLAMAQAAADLLVSGRASPDIHLPVDIRWGGTC